MKGSAVFSAVLIFLSHSVHATPARPADFVNLQTVLPEIQSDIRYFTGNNFTGSKVAGYHAPVCLLTRDAALALGKVEVQLLARGLTLKVYDCYRPQHAVDYFVAWAADSDDIAMQATFYPDVEKSALFRGGYIAGLSGHSRGSTVDLTIVPADSTIPEFDPRRIQVACTAPQSQRAPDNSLDFGTGFDCFSPLSHPASDRVSSQQKANRVLLTSLMEQAGFKPLKTEWWHFTFIREPYPATRFDFPVEE
ncbi:MAG TPA: D-alanyl-D-alanine dipeptidase [Morganella sp. (in: Bacteria)]|nr:D-alanyl-D-alanine dipeptidase [Morganella sp. (in: enterobacteria)]